MKYFLLLGLLAAVFYSCNNPAPAESSELAVSNRYDDLLELFKEWRAFENPPRHNGAPDYRLETFEQRQPAFIALQQA